MNQNFSKSIRVFSRLLNLIGAALIISGLILSVISKPALAGNDNKITICHAAGQAGTTHFETITISENAVYGPGGHFNENGTSQAGHEDDYFGECVVVTETTTPTVAVTTSVPTEVQTTEVPTETVTPTQEPTEDITETPTDEPTEQASETPTTSPTVVLIGEKLNLVLSYYCTGTNIDWIVSNPNSFSVSFSWEEDPGVVSGLSSSGGKFFSGKAVFNAASTGNTTLGAEESIVIVTSTIGTHVVRISYTLPGDTIPTVDQSTNGNDFCTLESTPLPTTVTPEVPSTETTKTLIVEKQVNIPVTGSTTVPTLQKPAVSSNQILIPVTGADHARTNKSGIQFINLGSILLGFGLVVQGLIKKK